MLRPLKGGGFINQGSTSRGLHQGLGFKAFLFVSSQVPVALSVCRLMTAVAT